MKKLEHIGLGRARPLRRIVAVVLLLQFLVLLAMAHSESLHRALHPDAGQVNHQCSVSMLRSGQVDAPECLAVAVPLVVAVEALAPVQCTIFVSVDFSLPPSRGPPAALS